MQQIQSSEDGQTGVNQGVELLIEDKKFIELDAPPERQVELAAMQQSARAYGLHIQSLLHKTVSHLRLGVRALHLLGNPAALVGQFDYKFSHEISSARQIPWP